MLTLSKSHGIGGTVKYTPEDFIVEEIAQNGAVLELGRVYSAAELGFGEASQDAKFTLFVMQKRDWNTVQALRTIARRARRGIKSMGFAGTKDRSSVSTQLCSVYGAKPADILGIRVKDISINGAWPSNREIRMGELSGNRFTIVVRNPVHPENVESVNRELDGVFPNYFGEQRFGARSNNVDIGIDIMKANFRSAAMRFLTDTSNERNEDAVAARERLAKEENFNEALVYFPKYLKYERELLAHLAANPTDFAGAIRKLPRSLSLMFVHSVDSYIFNKEVELRVGSSSIDRTEYGNMVGYDNEINDDEKSIIGELGITQDHFRVKGMPELNCKGGKRLLFAPYKDFARSFTDDGSLRMRFALLPGSYATVLLEEFMKSNEKEETPLDD